MCFYKILIYFYQRVVFNFLWSIVYPSKTKYKFYMLWYGSTQMFLLFLMPLISNQMKWNSHTHDKKRFCPVKMGPIVDDLLISPFCCWAITIAPTILCWKLEPCNSWIQVTHGETITHQSSACGPVINNNRTKGHRFRFNSLDTGEVKPSDLTSYRFSHGE